MNASFTPKTIGIVGGTGQMGRMFTRLFEMDGYEVLLSGLGTKLAPQEMAQKCDVVIVSVPMEATPAVIEELGAVLRPEQLLSDFTSTKAQAVEAMLSTPAQVIGAHPLFGPMPDPTGQNVVLSPARTPENSGMLEWYQGFFRQHGMQVIVMDPKDHDESMAFVQGLTHFINITFADTLREQKANIDQLLQVCSPVYRLFFATLCRILSGDGALYGQIQTGNPHNLPLLESFLANGTDLKQQVSEGDWKAVEAKFKAAAMYLGDYRHVARQESDFLIERMKELHPPQRSS